MNVSVPVQICVTALFAPGVLKIVLAGVMPALLPAPSLAITVNNASVTFYSLSFWHISYIPERIDEWRREWMMERREFMGKTIKLVAGAALAAQWASHAGAQGPQASQIAAEKKTAQANNPAQNKQPSPRRPNIVLIVADDLGYADVGVHGCADVPTPRINSIAQQGARFSNGYVSCPVCSPSRAGLLTGRYQQRFGHEFNIGPPRLAGPEDGLPTDQTMLAERLKALGYATGMFGKWHLGLGEKFHPQSRGFDTFYGFLGGGHSYLKVEDKPGDPIMRGKEPVTELDYATDAFARESCAFIDHHKDQPFFLYLPFNAVHTPLEALQPYLDRFAMIENPRRRTFAAMLSAMDDGVGRVLDKLHEHGLEQETLLFFISDNGGPTRDNTSSNLPLRGGKTTVYEGGIRVPFFVRWPGHVPAGATLDTPAIALDIFTTAVAAAGGVAAGDEKLDGKDLLPLLDGKQAGPLHETLYWRFGKSWAIRQGDWKLLSQDGGTPELYQLSQDLGEKNNQASGEPQQVATLQQAWDAWNSQLQPPHWARIGEKGKASKP